MLTFAWEFPFFYYNRLGPSDGEIVEVDYEVTASEGPWSKTVRGRVTLRRPRRMTRTQFDNLRKGQVETFLQQEDEIIGVIQRLSDAAARRRTPKLERLSAPF